MRQATSTRWSRYARAEADKWMDWTTSTLAGPFRDLFWGTLRTPPEQRDEALIEKALQTCGELLGVPDRALAGQSWLSGERFGMGDIPLGCFIYAWFEMPIERPPLPHLEAWYLRLRERPGVPRGGNDRTDLSRLLLHFVTRSLI
ncbi:Glutathione S-transferase GstB [Streptococcus dysgalactiae subsp. equisimilis]|nr:Glutathione S-transferase GstB [Streptococcus dysgalactiae subsp. equisimilis]